MGKKVKSICGIVMALLIVFGVIPTTNTITNSSVGTVETQAASYPSVSIRTCYASVGETAHISMTYMTAYYDYEELIISIYDQSGEEIGTTTLSYSYLFTLFTPSQRSFTVTWNSEGYMPGTYEIEVVKKYYNRDQWNTVPDVSTGYLYLTDDLGGIDGNNQLNEDQTHYVFFLEEMQDTVENTVCTAYSAWKKTAFTDYDIQLKEMYLGEEANEIVQEENSFNPSSSSGVQWVLMRFSLMNKTENPLKASDVLYYSSFYKYSGSRMNICETAVFSKEWNNMGIFDVLISPGEEEDVWIGILIPKEQQMPYLLIEDSFLNTNPAYVDSQNDSVHSYNDWTITKMPTFTETGICEKTCVSCGHKRIEDIPELTITNGWVDIKGHYYYYESKAVKTGWFYDGGYWYYLNPDNGGEVVIGLVKVGGKYYFMNAFGAMLTGWIMDNGIWYFANDSGALVTGWLKRGSSWYYMDPTTCVMQTGWVKVGNTWYYMSSSGAMVTGWQKINGTWYFFKSSGAMAANEWCGGYWLNANGSWTYQPKGSWKKDSVGWWFGDTSGWYAKNTTQKIDGVNYKFNAAGYWVQ